MNATVRLGGICFVLLTVVGCRLTADKAAEKTQSKQTSAMQPLVAQDNSLERKVTEAKWIVEARIANMYGSRLQNVEIKNQTFLWGEPLTTNAPVVLVRATDFIWSHWSQHKEAKWIFFLKGDADSGNGVDFYNLVGGGMDRDGMELATAETLERVMALIQQLKK